jgi:hypothetical protein
MSSDAPDDDAPARDVSPGGGAGVGLRDPPRPARGKYWFPGVVADIGTALDRYTRAIVVTFGLVSLVWSVLLLPVAKRSLHLVTWIYDQQTVYPSEATSGRPLPLEYGSVPVRSVRIVKLRIQNRGSAPIGTSDAVWYLDLTASGASHLVLLGAPRIDPAPVPVSPMQPDARTVRLALGVLDPRVTIDLDMLVINSDGRGLPIDEPRSTLPGLPQELTLASPAEVLEGRYFWMWGTPVMLLMLVWVGPGAAREWYAYQPTWKRVLMVPVYLLIMLLVVGVPAGLWVVGLSELVSRVY